MKLYNVVAIKNGDEFSEYLGSKIEDAISNSVKAWNRLSDSDKKHQTIECTEFTVSDDVDTTDESAMFDAICESGDYDLVSINY